MIWANVTKFGKNFIAPHIFLAGTPMQPIIDIALKRKKICMITNRAALKMRSTRLEFRSC